MKKLQELRKQNDMFLYIFTNETFSKQYRIVYTYENGNAYDVAIIDYH